MDVSAVNRNSMVSPPSTPASPVESPAQHREVIQAVKALNATEMFGEETELQYQKDPLTQRMVLQVVNRQTKEVISQIPARFALEMAAGLKAK